MIAHELRQLLIRWRGSYRMPRPPINSGFVNVPPLKRIPEPPPSYQEFKVMLGAAVEENEKEKALRRFLERFPGWIEEVLEYQEDLQEIRIHNMEWAELALATAEVTYQGQGMDPIDWVPYGPEKRGYRFMLISDFEFKRDEMGIVSRRKLYIPLYPERYLVSTREAGVAQRAEQPACTRQVAGSTPAASSAGR